MGLENWTPALNSFACLAQKIGMHPSGAGCVSNGMIVSAPPNSVSGRVRDSAKLTNDCARSFSRVLDLHGGVAACYILRQYHILVTYCNILAFLYCTSSPCKPLSVVSTFWSEFKKKDGFRPQT